jgi:hypothetical protein
MLVVLGTSPPGLVARLGGSPLRSRWLRFVPLFALLFGLAACEDDPAALPQDPVTPPQDVVSDFSLPDVNPHSTRFEETVSPRDYTGAISAWYFGHAT